MFNHSVIFYLSKTTYLIKILNLSKMIYNFIVIAIAISNNIEIFITKVIVETIVNIMVNFIFLHSC